MKKSILKSVVALFVISATTLVAQEPTKNPRGPVGIGTKTKPLNTEPAISTSTNTEVKIPTKGLGGRGGMQTKPVITEPTTSTPTNTEVKTPTKGIGGGGRGTVQNKPVLTEESPINTEVVKSKSEPSKPKSHDDDEKEYKGKGGNEHSELKGDNRYNENGKKKGKAKGHDKNKEKKNNKEEKESH